MRRVSLKGVASELDMADVPVIGQMCQWLTTCAAGGKVGESGFLCA